MSKLRISGDSSGYVDLEAPATAGTTTIALEQIPLKNAANVFTSNMGIGVTPSTSTITTLQGVWGTVSGWANNLGLMNNAVYNVGDKYINTDEASKIELADGTLKFKVAPSGSADAAISWTNAMTIDNAGDVGIGIASPTAKLHIEAPDNTDLMRFTVTGNEMWAFKGASAAGSNDTVSFGIAGGTQAMAWDESGIVTKPYQPAFLVGAGSNSALPLLAATKVNFDSEIFDQNSDFNTTTQTFTAPVTGKYQFNVQLLWLGWDSGAAYYYLQIVTSNRTYYELYSGAERSSDPSYCYGHIHVLADMDAGDTAHVSLYQNSGTSQTTYDGQSLFTGHLAC
tara:strand:- start:176 stop:1192 length:1017 start_codon:yes stop_codon:yes gene_type:complete